MSGYSWHCHKKFLCAINSFIHHNLITVKTLCKVTLVKHIRRQNILSIRLSLYNRNTWKNHKFYTYVILSLQNLERLFKTNFRLLWATYQYMQESIRVLNMCYCKFFTKYDFLMYNRIGKLQFIKTVTLVYSLVNDTYNIIVKSESESM